MVKRYHFLFGFILVLLVVCLTGCGSKKASIDKIKDLEFTVVENKEIPEELLAIIEEKKSSEFKMTYKNEGCLYICRGYGKQETGGYSIAVNELYLAENAIYINTSLIGPAREENSSNAPSYPYIVVKVEFIDKSVVFQ